MAQRKVFSPFIPLSQADGAVQRGNQSSKHHILWCLKNHHQLVGFNLNCLIFLQFPPFFRLARMQIGDTIDRMEEIGAAWSSLESIGPFSS